jgi:hypothetical protein
MSTRPIDSVYSSIILSYCALTFDERILSPKKPLANASVGSDDSLARISASFVRSSFPLRKRDMVDLMVV